MLHANGEIRPSYTIGDFTITDAYSDDPSHIAIYKSGGEGGDFDKTELEKVIAEFYASRF